MSIPTKEQANRFLAPLRGSLSVLLLHDTQAKLRLSRFMLQCASLRSLDTTVFDTDAFYSTNMKRLTEDTEPIKGEVLLLPGQSFAVVSLLPLLSSKRELLIIDDLNSLYSLASDGKKSQSQQLTILIKLLSHNARMNDSWVVATAYAPASGPRRASSQRSLTALADEVVDATVSTEGAVQLRADFDQWTNGEFAL